MNKYILGIDIGTQSIKICLFDLNGHIVSKNTHPQYMENIKPGWATEKPELWWESICIGIKKIIETKCIQVEEIACVGVAAIMHSPVGLTRDGELVEQEVQMYCDKRNSDIVNKMRNIDGLEKQIHDISANLPGTQWMGMKIEWIKNNKPEVYEKTYKFVSAKDYINFKLCGELAIDPTEASGSCLMDANTNNWSQEILDLLNIDRHKLPDIKSSSEIIGTIHKNAAKSTGLKEGTPVVCGAGDMLCGLLGAGLTKKDLLMDLTGTGSIIAYYDDNPRINHKIANVRHVLKGWTPYNSLDSSGGALRWFSDTCCKKEKELAEREKKDLFSYLGAKAAMTSAGADGVMFLPYLQGERTMGSSYSKGTFIGMTPATTNAHMVRAIMEGVAFEHKRTIELFSSNEIEFTKLIHTGGAAKSIIWSQIKADIYELPLEISQTEECTAWGAAILAAVGVGLYSDIAQAVENTYQNGCVLVPNTQNTNRYREMFELYTNIHDILQQPFEKLAKII